MLLLIHFVWAIGGYMCWWPVVRLFGLLIGWLGDWWIGWLIGCLILVLVECLLDDTAIISLNGFTEHKSSAELYGKRTQV